MKTSFLLHILFVALVGIPGFAKAAEVPTEEELAKAKAELKGTWQVTSAEEGGVMLPAGVISELKHVFDGDALIMVVGEKEKLAQYKLNPTTSPKSIDIIKKDKIELGIYELDGDTLRICLTKDLQRPTKFESKSETSPRMLATFKRVVEKKPE